MNKLWTLSAGILVLATQGPAQRSSFEVVSIKANKSGNADSGMGPRGGSLVATNVTLNALLLYAYSEPTRRLRDAQLLGEPGWARSDHFDIEAKPGGGAPVLPGDQTKVMMRSLLEDYFQLRIHRETRDLPVYDLVLRKGRLKLSSSQTPVEPIQARITIASEGEQLSPAPRGTLRMVKGPVVTVLKGTAISVPQIILLLQSRSDRIIVDKTDIEGLLDVDLTFRPDLLGPAESPAPADSSAAEPDQVAAPSLFSAIQAIGLKLEASKAPLEVLVIDHVDRPVQN